MRIGAHRELSVFPTPVGVFLLTNRSQSAPGGLPHARGGVSYAYELDPMKVSVFPTPVGVFLIFFIRHKGCGGLPHARGGVSEWAHMLERAQGSSPRPWGCFLITPDQSVIYSVFPTPVGVFLLTALAVSQPLGLPHARGGVSQRLARASTATQSSPRPWGCFWK